MADTSSDVLILDEVPPVAPPEPSLVEEFATPHFPAPEPEPWQHSELAYGIPPLLPDAASLHAVLGGPPIPMMIIRRPGDSLAGAALEAEAAPTPPPRLTLAEVACPTFAGPPASGAILRQQISTARSTLSGIITAILAAQETLPEIFKNLSAASEEVPRQEYFVLAEAMDFYERLTAALASIRP